MESKPTFDFSGPEGNVFNILALLDNAGLSPSEKAIATMQYAGICYYFITKFRGTYEFVNVPDAVFDYAENQHDD